MTEIVEAKIRKIGTSYGILLPREVMIEDGLKEGQKICFTILKKNLKLIDASFGIFKNVKVPFERDRTDRLERYERSKKDAA